MGKACAWKSAGDLATALHDMLAVDGPSLVEVMSDPLLT